MKSPEGNKVAIELLEDIIQNCPKANTKIYACVCQLHKRVQATPELKQLKHLVIDKLHFFRHSTNAFEFRARRHLATVAHEVNTAQTFSWVWHYASLWSGTTPGTSRPWLRRSTNSCCTSLCKSTALVRKEAVAKRCLRKKHGSANMGPWSSSSLRYVSFILLCIFDILVSNGFWRTHQFYCRYYHIRTSFIGYTIPAVSLDCHFVCLSVCYCTSININLIIITIDSVARLPVK